MTAPVRPRTMTAEQWREEREALLFGDADAGAFARELDAERAAHDATLARLADVERGRAADVRRLGVATGRRFIPDERIADIDVVEHAMVTVRVQAEAAKEAIAAAEQRLARLRPLVQAVLSGNMYWIRANNLHMHCAALDPTDRAWATEEER